MFGFFFFRIHFVGSLPRNISLSVLECVEIHGVEVGVMVVVEKLVMMYIER